MGCGEQQENYNEVTASVRVTVPDVVFSLKYISKYPVLGTHLMVWKGNFLNSD